MLYELEKKDYSLLEPMLISGFQFPEVSAVIDSINSGWIVTNDPKQPASALMWAEGLGGFFLLGLCGKLKRVFVYTGNETTGV
ncbi:hypothetical protein AMQ84_07045 [Paenibacillus riograndensis]|uniref:Uncharacterized protein n=1 Tax=Paenibacillus riograndensis TaxID=483937 RepID=A0A132U7V7_9BACL|nr:hypothetical protein [Paenibacillus riograndensis]KWX79466.1 hypothetical protein AMQ84_07045 [Paenibacillus riograndensis]